MACNQSITMSFLILSFILTTIISTITASIHSDSSDSNHKDDYRPEDRCDYEDPDFPYALAKLTDYRRKLTIAHSVIMIWIFIFAIPVSSFPVLWHRLAPNKVRKGSYIKQWIITHIKYTVLIYPLMTVSVVSAMVVKHDSMRLFPNSKCSFYNQFHEMLGIGCFMMYTFQFLMSFFSYESLLNEVYRSFRFYHGISNALAYVMSVPLIAMCRVAAEEGANRHLYFLSYFFFFMFQIYIYLRMKFADFAALEVHMLSESEIANENKGVILKTSQWLWNFGMPSQTNDGHLVDLKPQKSISRIYIQQYLDAYTNYWRLTNLMCFTIATILTVYLSLLYSGIFQSSANYFPMYHTFGDLFVNWSVLEIYAI